MSSNKNENFYTKLPVIENFFDASNADNYHSMPENWYVAVTDIVNSTSAIDEDRYKAVNFLGVSPIVAMLNIGSKNEIPFVFGGDGCSLCIPPYLYDDAQKVLGACKHISKSEYDLELRAAIYPLSVIKEEGHQVNVARYRPTEHYIQGVFSGGGISHAEELLKDPGLNEYNVPVSPNPTEVDFSGLECRWQEVRQPQKEVITLLIKSNPNRSNDHDTYQKVLQKMRDIFGFDDTTNPIDSSELKMNLSSSKLSNEITFRTYGQNWFKKVFYQLKIQLQIIIGKVLMALDYETSVTNWSLYKEDLALNSDHRKFDDMLRVVISGTTEQRKELTSFLESLFNKGELAYGFHISDAAMITCMVFEYHRDHIHFVDGNGGGYVSASKQLKDQLDRLQEQ